MQSIGERLEEARKRKGISLREAAEATKIRSDFLGYFEQNKFDYDLPDLYKRGFLKNYARYLKLDPEKLVTDYNALQLSNSRATKRGAAELFGQIEIKKSEGATAANEAESEDVGYGHISSRPTSTSEETDEADKGEDNEKVFYLKIGLVFAGTLALVFVVFGLIKAILSSSGDEPEIAELREPSAITEPADSSVAAINGDDITLLASGTVYVLVKQQEDNEILYRDTMSEGETVSLSKSGPVDILFTAGENIQIEHAGERMRPSSSGTAKITLP
jgi:transcriptional regulator with XRE-family HTH domain